MRSSTLENRAPETVSQEDILADLWPRVRKKHLFPELPKPVITQGDIRVGLDVRAKKIHISESFVRSCSDRLETPVIMECLLDHALAHHLFCPWDLGSQMKMYYRVKQVLPERDRAVEALELFMDVVADTHLVLRDKTLIPQLYRVLPHVGVRSAVMALCQKIWGMDLGIQGRFDFVDRLSRIPYLDRRRWPENAARFAQAVGPLLEKQNNGDVNSPPCPMGAHGLQSYSRQDIEDGLKTLANDVDTPREFRDIIMDFEDDIRAGRSASAGVPGLGLGRELDADLLYYMKLAENYHLPIRKRPMVQSTGLYPHQHIPWEISKPVRDIDPWTSLGRIMPGLTQTWRHEQGRVYGNKEETPDCIIIIDSSSSMIHPSRFPSFAVLGAASACDAYLRNDARVAVYNFGDASAGARRILPYTRRREEVFQSLCHYFGGGTRIRTEDIDSLQNDSQPDIFLITDMEIHNLDQLTQYFIQRGNRTTAVHIGYNRHVRNFRQDTENHHHINIFSVERTEDIPAVILGSVKHKLYS